MKTQGIEVDGEYHGISLIPPNHNWQPLYNYTHPIHQCKDCKQKIQFVHGEVHMYNEYFLTLIKKIYIIHNQTIKCWVLQNWFKEGHVNPVPCDEQCDINIMNKALR